MERRVGARSSQPSNSQGFRSIRPKTQERSRQADLTKNPWSPEGRRHPSQQKATGIENLLRYAMLRKGINFVEQASIGPWCVDFYLPDHNACLEADGEYWHGTVAAKMKDRRKDAWLKSRGYSVFHFDGWDIQQDADFCVSRMMKSLEAHVNKLVAEPEEEYEDIADTSSIEIQEENDNQAEQRAGDDEYESWVRGQPRNP